MTNLFETIINSAVQSVEPSPEFTEILWNRINNNSRKSSARNRLSGWFWIPVSAVMTLIIILTVVSPQKVVAAFKSFIAYLPGIGFVQDDESTLYLSEPVIIEQNGITLTIEQVVADSSKTVISYRIDNLPVDGSNKISSCFYDNNQLLLPDGKTQLPIGGGVENNQARIEFFPLPEGVTQATLLVSMNLIDPSCSAPQEWKVDFSLGTMPTDIELLPVIQNQETQPSSDVSEVAQVTESTVADFQMIVDQMVELEDGYLILGHTEWLTDSWNNVRIDMEKAYALDAEGKNIPLGQTDEGSSDNQFAFKIASKEFATPITLHAESLLIIVNTENSPVFSFDAGSNPQVGQTWDLNQDLEIAGKKITINSIRAFQQNTGIDQENMINGYAIEASSLSDDFDGFIICEGQGENSDIWGQTMPINETTKSLESFYPQELPSGQVTCHFQNLQFELAGSWQVEWQPPSETE